MYALLLREFAEVRRHGGQPLADRVVEDDIAPLLRPCSLLPCRGQCSQFVVPFPIQGVGNQTVARIDEHESPLCEIRFDLGALHGAAA